MITRLRRRAAGDAGQMPIALVLVTFIFLLVVIFWFAIPLGQATDQKAGSQSAADAAALAAAEHIRDDLGIWILNETRTADPEHLDRFFDHLEGQFGQSAAENYADLNAGVVTAYSYDHVNDRVDVTVEGKATVTESAGQHSTSSAQAELGLDLGNCRVVDDPTEEPDEPDPDDPDADAPDPADPVVVPDVGTELRCGGLVLHFTIGGEDQGVSLNTDVTDLTDLFDIRLVG
jgi:hypothetical protein